MLDAEQLRRFREDGFLVLEGLVPASRCDGLRARAADLVRGFDPGELRLDPRHLRALLPDRRRLRRGDAGTEEEDRGGREDHEAEDGGKAPEGQEDGPACRRGGRRTSWRPARDGTNGVCARKRPDRTSQRGRCR